MTIDVRSARPGAALEQSCQGCSGTEGIMIVDLNTRRTPIWRCLSPILWCFNSCLRYFPARSTTMISPRAWPDGRSLIPRRTSSSRMRNDEGIVAIAARVQAAAVAAVAGLIWLATVPLSGPVTGQLQSMDLRVHTAGIQGPQRDHRSFRAANGVRRHHSALPVSDERGP